LEIKKIYVNLNKILELIKIHNNMQEDSKVLPDSKELWVDPTLTIIPSEAVQSGPTRGAEDSDISPS
jgi:hypothetical protein